MITMTLLWSLAMLPPVTPLASAHSHNDYEQKRPLHDALDQGFCSVEADIWLRPEGLLVAHTVLDLNPDRTLEKLYLDPLRERIKAKDGKVHRNGPAFFLMIDVKTDAKLTYAALDKVLAKYADILSVTQNGKHETRAVTVVLSGNRDKETIAKQTLRFASLDGRPDDLDSDAAIDRIPWISASWSSLFKWKGEGPMPEAERKKLNDYVAKVHSAGRKVRFWATPEKVSVWKELIAAKVDFLNTDKLANLRAFLTAQ